MMKNTLKPALTAAAILMATVTTVSTVNAQGRPGEFAPTAGTSNVNVINTPTVKDVDAPGRKALQTSIIQIPAAAGVATFHSVATVPANERLVIEYVSGGCGYITIGSVALASYPGNAPAGFEYMPKAILTDGISTPVRFYANAGETFGVWVNNLGGQGGFCGVTLTGYYISVP